jgi:2-polyprenyl-3-methyl-5-hydroxy-6-metoxy-1,4-benzoquinol methylase
VEANGERAGDRLQAAQDVRSQRQQRAIANGRIYGSENHNIVALVGNGRRVLDIGCGSGAIGPALRSRGATELVGVEIVPSAAEQASRVFDRVVHAPIEEVELASLGGEPFDTLIAADVLEHLVDPWSQLSRWRAWVKPTGLLAISVPNLQHWKVLVELMFNGRFDYDPSGGVMDSTHLRWFTKRSLGDQLRQAGWEPVRWTLPQGGWSMRLDRATGRIGSDFLVRQLTVAARPIPSRD